jgi:hypothetical protein
MLAEQLLEGEAEVLIRKAIERALAGDSRLEPRTAGTTHTFSPEKFCQKAILKRLFRRTETVIVSIKIAVLGGPIRPRRSGPK